MKLCLSPDPSDTFGVASICMYHGQMRAGGIWEGKDILGQCTRPVSLASKLVGPLECTDSETLGLCSLAAGSDFPPRRICYFKSSVRSPTFVFSVVPL